MPNTVVLPPVQVVSACGGRCALYTSRSPAREGSNQDAAAIVPYSPGAGAILVADGLGGMRSGEVAADIAVSSVCESIQQLVAADGGSPGDWVNPAVGAAAEANGAANGRDNGAPPSTGLRGAILDGLERANQRILSEANGSATTIVIVEVRDREIRTYHVGDSMVLVCGGRGKLKFQTVCHSPVGFAVEAGMIDEEEAMHHVDRHIVSNVIGCPEMRIEIGPSLELARRDTVLLATDGLFDNLHMSEIVERVRKGPLDKAVARLANDATERMLNPAPGLPSKPDDLTIVAFRPGS